MSKFGGEGTGFKSMKDVKWKNDEDVTLIVEGERLFVPKRFVHIQAFCGVQCRTGGEGTIDDF